MPERKYRRGTGQMGFANKRWTTSDLAGQSNVSFPHKLPELSSNVWGFVVDFQQVKDLLVGQPVFFFFFFFFASC